jgi:predicted transcriptional regulator of viral defense system
MHNYPQASENKLFEVAESQQGYFTTRQAKISGYQDNTHAYHVRCGAWLRVYRGIYRLAKFPQTERPDLMIWALWSCNRQGEMEGVYSHQTALSIHHLSDVMPDKLHMTVPPFFRRNSALPPILKLHRKRLQKDRVVSLDGYLVTTVYQTLLDVIEVASISHDLIIQALEVSAKEGSITQKMLKQLFEEPAVRGSPIYRYLKEA